MKPWEEEHKRKNERERSGSEESVREGESGLLGLDPHLKSLSLLFFLFFTFFGITVVTTTALWSNTLVAATVGPRRL